MQRKFVNFLEALIKQVKNATTSVLEFYQMNAFVQNVLNYKLMWLWPSNFIVKLSDNVNNRQKYFSCDYTFGWHLEFELLSAY